MAFTPLIDQMNIENRFILLPSVLCTGIFFTASEVDMLSRLVAISADQRETCGCEMLDWSEDLPFLVDWIIPFFD